MLIAGYSEITLVKAGIRTAEYIPGYCWGAHIRLEGDAAGLFPYINARFSDAKYHHQSEHIQFFLHDYQCTLYPDLAIASPFADKTEARTFADQLVHFLNDLDVGKDSLVPDFRKYKPISVIDLYRLLPGNNCRECGFASCMAFAVALSTGGADQGQCYGFKSPMYENAVYPIFDKKGNLASTVELEIDTEKRQYEKIELKQRIEHLEKRLATELSNNSNHNDEYDTGNRSSGLTGREMQVLRLMADGATNTEISQELSISRHTVKSHVVHIFNKLGVNDRTQAAVWAARNQLV